MSRLRLLLGLLPVFFFTQHAVGQMPEYPFQSGESIRYGAFYNWHFIWIHSGEVVFSADTLNRGQQKTWQLKAVGKTFKAYDLLYNVRDTFLTSCTYETFRPIQAYRAVNHAQSGSVHHYRFDHSLRKVGVKIQGKKQASYTGTIPFQENTFDLLATAYHFRQFDFDKLFVGQKIPFRMLIDRQTDEVYFRYLGKEVIKTRNGKAFRCHKVSVYLLQGDFFPQGEHMKVWFTDDRNHLPVLVESEIQVGSVKAMLTDFKSLKYPLTSEVK